MHVERGGREKSARYRARTENTDSIATVIAIVWTTEAVDTPTVTVNVNPGGTAPTVKIVRILPFIVIIDRERQM